MKRTYEEMPPISRSEAERAFASGNTDDIVRALIRLALNDPDWNWVQARCLTFLQHKDRWVRRAAATSLGHLARIHGRLNLDTVKPQLERLVNDPEMEGAAEDALDDIRHHIRQ